MSRIRAELSAQPAGTKGRRFKVSQSRNTPLHQSDLFQPQAKDSRLLQPVSNKCVYLLPIFRDRRTQQGSGGRGFRPGNPLASKGGIKVLQRQRQEALGYGEGC